MVNSNKNKIISVRLSTNHYERLLNDGTDRKISAKAQKILSDHLDSICGTIATWITLPNSLGKYLFSIINDEQLSDVIDILYKEVSNLNVLSFPDKSLWETWLLMQKSLNRAIGGIYS